jgi:hypothetical protein
MSIANLREAGAERVRQHLSGRFSLPVKLRDSNGAEYTTTGSVLYDTIGVNPDDGAEVIHSNPIVVLSKADLSRVPLSGEKWIIEIPVIPDASAPKEKFLMSPDSPLRGGSSLGFITMELKKLDQV